MMVALKTDIRKLQALHSAGMSVTEMAEALGVDKSNVSRQLKKLGLAVAAVTVRRTAENAARDKTATEHYKEENAAIKHLLFLADKAKSQLEWIEETVPPQATKEYREWMDSKLSWAAEMRKLIDAMSDVGYKLFHTEEIKEILGIILDEIGNEAPDCQKRIYARIERRRAIRFPSFFNG
jgi:predicted transcriptional regulator